MKLENIQFSVTISDSSYSHFKLTRGCSAMKQQSASLKADRRSYAQSLALYTSNENFKNL